MTVAQTVDPHVRQWAVPPQPIPRRHEVNPPKAHVLDEAPPPGHVAGTDAEGCEPLLLVLFQELVDARLQPVPLQRVDAVLEPTLRDDELTARIRPVQQMVGQHQAESLVLRLGDDGGEELPVHAPWYRFSSAPGW